MSRRLFLPLIVCCALGFAGCNRAPSDSRLPATDVMTYEVRGVVKKINAERGKALIAHEAIAGYMDAMTMGFDVPDAAALAALRPGDAIVCRLSVSDTHGWIDRFQKTGEVSVAAVSLPTGAPAAGALEPGTPLPDCALIDQNGRGFRLSDFKGRALAFTFIFTRCPLPDLCPRMNRHLSAVQSALAAGATTNWHLVSLSFDPDYDTPERLSEYAARYHPDAAHWTFATGRAEDVRKLGTAFGLAFFDQGTPLNHNLRTVVVDAAGRVQKVFAGNEWSPPELAGEMKRAMAAQP